MFLVTRRPFGHILRAFRKDADLTQQVLAEEVGYTQGHLNRIETGQRNPPSSDKVLALAKALRLGYDDSVRLLAAAGHEDFRFLTSLQGPHIGRASFGFPKPQDLPPYTLPVARLVADALSDPRIPAAKRREMEKKIESFVRWLHAETCRDQSKGK